MQLPPALKEWCEISQWSLFRFTQPDVHRLEIHPVMPDEDRNEDVTSGFHASLSPDGRLWIPADLRQLVGLGEQSVMVRAENGGIGIYLRKVFETLGFGP